MTSTDNIIEATEEINDLQIKLQTANDIVHELKSENEELKRQYETANAFSKANQQRHAEWKAAWKVEREVISMREKQLEKDEAKWKVKLDDLRKEANELERKKLLNNNNIEGTKVHSDLLKDIETQQDSKTEALIHEVSETFFFVLLRCYEVQFMITSSCT